MLTQDIMQLGHLLTVIWCCFESSGCCSFYSLRKAGCAGQEYGHDNCSDSEQDNAGGDRLYP